MSATPINPLRGIILNNIWFNYESGSYRESQGIRNSVTDGQGDRSIQVLGKVPETFAITLVLQNDYNIHYGASDGGATTWVGSSQLYNLKSFIGAEGVSLPINFVNPYGITRSVVPTGAIDIEEFLSGSPSDDGVEFKVSLSLEAEE